MPLLSRKKTFSDSARQKPRLEGTSTSNSKPSGNSLGNSLSTRTVPMASSSNNQTRNGGDSSISSLLRKVGTMPTFTTNSNSLSNTYLNAKFAAPGIKLSPNRIRNVCPSFPVLLHAMLGASGRHKNNGGMLAMRFVSHKYNSYVG